MRMDEFAQERPVELGDDSAHVRMVAKHLDALDDILDESIANVGHALLRIPGSDGFRIRNRRLGETNGDLGHSAI